MEGDALWRREVLSNGLRVLLFPRASDITMQLAVAVEYGSNADSAADSGKAHFLEHMLPGGSDRRIELSRDIERLGGSSDFLTTNEYTLSTVDIAPDRVSEASHILSSLVFDSWFEQEKLDLERKIILNEITEAADDSGEKVVETLKRCLFKAHPMRLPILGSRKTVNQLSLNKIAEAHQTHYTPQSMILTLTGKFTEKDAATALQNFDDKENHQQAPRETYCLEAGKPVREAAQRRLGIHQAYLSMGVRTVPVKHRDRAAIDLIDTIIGANTSSRLFIELREKRGLTYSIYSFHECGKDYGYFHIDCATKHRNLEKTVSLIHREIERMRTEKVSEKELSQSKDMLKGENLRLLDNPLTRPETLARTEIWYRSEKALSSYFQTIDEVTAEEIRETANKYLEETNISTSILTQKTTNKTNI